MPITLPCPECQKTLRAPDNAVGKKIRCPACKAIVVVPAAEEELVEPEEEFEQPDEDTAVTETPKKKAAWEEKSSPSKKKKGGDEENDDGYGVAFDDDDDEDDDERRPRKKKKKKRRYDDDDDFDNFGDMRSRGRSRGAAHRGVVVLILGICSIPATCLCVLLAWILAAIAVNMGNEDLAKMNSGVMDKSGRGMTTAGVACAWVGAGLGIIVFILNIAFICGGGGRFR